MSFSNAMFISTRACRPDEKLKYWSSMVNKHVVHIDCPNISTTPIEAELTSRQSDELSIHHIIASTHSVHRSVVNIDLDKRDSIFACLMEKGSGYSYQGTHCVEHSAGDLILYDTSNPYGHGFPSDMSMYVMDIPKEYCEDISIHSGQILKIGKGISSGLSSTELLLQTLRKPTNSSCEFLIRREELLSHIRALTHIATKARVNPYLKALYLECLDFIEDNLSNGELSVGYLSQQLGVASRQISRAFEQHNASVHRYIWDRRLLKSRKDLVGSNHWSITDIAFKWGFNHSAHFSRAYKQCFGETPSQTRARLLRAP